MTPLTALLLDWVLTAFWPIVGSSGTSHYSGVLFAQGGLFIGGLALLPWLAAASRWKMILSRRTMPLLLGMGFLSGTATAIYISALAYTTPANAAIVAQVEVVYSSLLCAFLLKERLSWRQAAAASLVVGGTGLILAHDLSSSRWKGDLMIAATPWMYQCSHILSRRLPKDMDPLIITGGRIFYGLLTMTPWCLWQLAHEPKWSWRPQALSVLLVQGLAMSGLNFLLWYKAIRGMDVAKATTILLSYPALTVLFSGMLGREAIRPEQLAGLALTFAGAYWVSCLVIQSSVAARAK